MISAIDNGGLAAILLDVVWPFYLYDWNIHTWKDDLYVVQGLCDNRDNIAWASE